MKHVIGLDLGTTCVKALVFDQDGQIISEAAMDDALITSRMNWVEQDAVKWVELSVTAIRNALEKAGIDKNSVSAISVSSQGITVVPVDENFEPLSNAINWLDMRAEQEIARISSIGADKLYGLSGKAVSSGYTLAKLMWIKNNWPDIFQKARYFLLPHDFLIAFLSGVVATDHSMASATMMYDVAKQCWSDELLGLFGIDKARLPQIMWSGEVAGTLTEKASQLLGLPGSVAVVIGGQDQKVAAYGAHIQKGSTTISMGTCGAYEFMFDTPTFHPSRALPVFSFLEPGKWVLEGCMNTAGAAIKWGRDQIFKGLQYDDMNRLAGNSPPGANGVTFFPYLSGSGTPYFKDAKGVFAGLTLDSGREDIARAIFESIAYETRVNLEAAVDAGVETERFLIFGGGSKSALLCQVIADVTGCNITSFDCTEMGATGAGKLCAKAMGYRDFGAALLTKSKEWVCDARRHEQYNALYAQYSENMQYIFKIK